MKIWKVNRNEPVCIDFTGEEIVVLKGICNTYITLNTDYVDREAVEFFKELSKLLGVDCRA